MGDSFQVCVHDSLSSLCLWLPPWDSATWVVVGWSQHQTSHFGLLEGQGSMLAQGLLHLWSIRTTDPGLN